MIRNDPLWKGIIQDLVFPFLTFFFPEEPFDFKYDLVRRLVNKNYNRNIIRALMNFIRFYVKLSDEKLNLMFEKKVEKLVTNKNLSMGVEEILLQQAEEKGLEKGFKKGRKEERKKAQRKLKETIRNMLAEGFGISVICKVLEVSEDFVRAVQEEN